MKQLLLSLMVVFAAITAVQAAPIYQYNNSTTGTPTYTDGNLSTASNLTAVGTSSATPCGSGFSGISGFTGSAYSTSGPYIEINLVAASGYTINVTQFDAGLRRSTTGPANVMYAYSIDGGSTWVSQGTPHNPVNSGCVTSRAATTVGVWNTCATATRVIFRMYPYGASGSGGTLQIYTLNIQGAVVLISSITPPSIAAAGPTTFCAGSNVILNATTGTGYQYQWYNGTTAIAGATRSSYTANASGIYTARMSGPVFCFDTTNAITVTVNPPPSAPTIAPTGGSTICSFDSVVLSGPAGYTYQWRNISGNIPGATNITYAANTSGTYRLVITNAAGCSATSSNAYTLTVNPAAPATITASRSLSFCLGDSVTLTGVPGTGNTYQWYDGGTPITGATSNVYTFYNTGSYQLHITNAVGCVTITNPSIVTAISSPIITAASDTEFCTGGAVRLSINTIAGATGILYQWKNDTTRIPGATSTSYNVTTSGYYTNFVTVPGSCSISSNVIRVVVNPIPTPVITFSGTTVRTQNYYTSYQWYLNTVTITGATTNSVTAHNNGSYRVFVTDTNGCSKLSNAFALNNLAVGDLLASSDIRLYPNPATNTLFLENGKEMLVVFSSVEGRKELEFAGREEMNIATLANGLHLVTLYDKKGQRIGVQKLIKE